MCSSWQQLAMQLSAHYADQAESRAEQPGGGRNGDHSKRISIGFPAMAGRAWGLEVLKVRVGALPPLGILGTAGDTVWQRPAGFALNTAKPEPEGKWIDVNDREEAVKILLGGEKPGVYALRGEDLIQAKAFDGFEEQRVCATKNQPPPIL